MSINGISGNNYYQNQTMLNMYRLSGSGGLSSAYHAVSPVKRVQKVDAGNSDYTKTAEFLKEYQSKLANLESSAAKLQDSNGSNVFRNYDVDSSNEAVASVEEQYRLRPGTDIELEVQSIARAQKNVSSSHFSQEQVEAGADMEFEITGADGASQKISVGSTNENGTQKTYNQMYQEAAKTINANSKSDVSASVSNVEGKVSLVLTSKATGESGSFKVSGNMGSAGGMEEIAAAAQNAVYTVKQNGTSQTFQSESNRVSLDAGRIEADLKSEGTTNVFTGIDTDKVTAAVSDLVDDYNDVSKLLKENAGRGRGTANQLLSFNRGMADEKTLNKVGISYNKDGELQLDKEKLASALQNDYEGTRSILSGQFGIAEKAASRADNALSDSVQSIVSNDLAIEASKRQDTDEANFQYYSNFARSGPYNLGNFYAVGLMLNTLA